MDDEIRRLIGSKADSAAIKQAAVSRGMVLLKEEAAEKIFAGITTTEEVMRMTQQEVEV
jgi:type II secretory ATPase GspE/PulE/Tfp pilus assembly ATPase PilB-like protein